MVSQSKSLSVDVMEHVLSFLSIPTICRMRVVCKEWNELTNNATFHPLCDKNGKNEGYLFLWRKDSFLVTSHKSVSPRFGAAFHFFDLDMERWYSIPSSEVLCTCGGLLNEETGQQFLSMDNGLICEGTAFYDTVENFICFSILDPVAKKSKRLPSLQLQALEMRFPPRSSNVLRLDPSLVIVVDQVTQSYRVFFFNILEDTPLVHVLESSIQKWRPIARLTQPMDDMIAFQNTAFASISKGVSLQGCFQLRLSRYQVEGDYFAQVWQMHFQRTLAYSKLVVRHNRLFVLVITRLPRSILISDSEDESEPESETCFQTYQDEKGALFEMYEILLDEGSSKPVVQFTQNAIDAIWGDDCCPQSWFGFPCFDSKGDYSSIVLMQHHSGEMRRFHLATGLVDELPAWPLSTTIPHRENVTSTFDAKTMPLSLRDVLKHASPTA